MLFIFRWIFFGIPAFICSLFIRPFYKDLWLVGEYGQYARDNGYFFFKYIRENYTSDIKLSTVAKLKSVSPEHLSRTFKSCIGNGFNEYVTLLRLKLAEEMIKNEPDKTISEIAYECGFNDGNYFSYKFKKMYGISPIKAREDNK